MIRGLYLRKLLRSFAFAVASLCLAAVNGCGPDKPEGFDSFTPHIDVIIGSTNRGGGQLFAWFDFTKPVELTCENLQSMIFCTGSDPGFAGLEHETGQLFPLFANANVALELIEADSGVRAQASGVIAANPGDLIPLGSAPELHAHVEWQFVATSPQATAFARFRLVDASPQPRYQPSPPFDIQFVLTVRTP